MPFFSIWASCVISYIELSQTTYTPSPSSYQLRSHSSTWYETLLWNLSYSKYFPTLFVSIVLQVPVAGTVFCAHVQSHIHHCTDSEEEQACLYTSGITRSVTSCSRNSKRSFLKARGRSISKTINGKRPPKSSYVCHKISMCICRMHPRHDI